MSTKKKLLEAAAGAAGGGVTYVDDVFATHLYRGNSSTKTITNGIDVGGEGGLVWIKNLITGSGIAGHFLMDTVQPQVSSSQAFLSSNSTAKADGASNMVSAFNSDGFSLGANNRINNSGTDYVSWTFRKTPGFLDIVTYTGDGTQNRPVSHNLGSTPGMILIKSLDVNRGWFVWHRGISATWTGNKTPGSTAGGNDVGLLSLNSTNAFNSGYGGFTYADDTAFGLYRSNSDENVSGENYVAYIFAHDAQEFGENEDEAIIKCGSYTGNGSSTGPSINLGFEPQWVLIKSATSSQEWFILDSMRGVVTGGNDAYLQADTSAAEGSYDLLEFTSTGFNITTTSGWANSSSTDYIYMAIRRPFKPASELNSVDLFKPIIYTGTGTQLERVDPPASPTNIDLMFFKSRSLNGRNWEVVTRQMSSWPHSVGQGGSSPKGLHFNTTDAEADVYSFSTLDGRNIAVNQDGATNLNVNGENYSVCRFARAPGFFDVACYKGTGAAPLVVNHNLGVTPELMIFTDRDYTSNWWVWHPYLGTNEALKLNSSDANVSNGSVFNNYNPTSTTFSVWTETGVGASGSHHLALLFASTDGVSKVSKYTGTGSDLNVNCGFSSGARFVMIKRIDSTGDWYVWDTARGIVAGNDGYLRLNLANDEDSADWIDPLSSGFTITSSAPAALNANGGEYLFLAIA